MKDIKGLELEASSGVSRDTEKVKVKITMEEMEAKRNENGSKRSRCIKR